MADVSDNGIEEEQPNGFPFRRKQTVLKRLTALQSSHSYVVYSYYQGAGFGNFVNGLLTMYAVAICKGAAFRGALPSLLLIV